MPITYAQKLLGQLAAYHRNESSGALDRGVTHESKWRPSGSSPEPGSADRYRQNILPGIRDEFWAWFDAQTPPLELRESFAAPDSSQALAFNLFFPFLRQGQVDTRLLKVIGVNGGEYQGRFEKVLDTDENTRFDFYMEAVGGQKIFFEVKLAETGFGACEDNERQREKLERTYRPHLTGHVDAKWLEPGAFFANDRVLRTLSYLGRYPDSGLAFIFPKANDGLKEAEQAIKQIVSKTLAPRVAILYFEYLVERILEETAEDAALHAHFIAFRDKYVCL